MGKKTKTGDNLLPADVFDKLLIESTQAATITLLLDSPEDDVVNKACSAIFRFAEKCDENKQSLLSINCLDKLLRLLQHDELVVRRLACMAIGSMSQHPEVRKALRQREETIPLMVRMLVLEDDRPVHEYVTLCLSSMAVDYSCKVYICQQGGMEPLIQCLYSNDPDIQKNAIQTITLMLQDFDVKSTLLSFNGLPAIIKLLKSEFPVIQYQALLALQLAAEDCECRGVLTDLNIASVLLEYLENPSCQDLHVFAVVLLSSCLEDQNTVKVFKDLGGLQKLVSFITESAVVAFEEDKKGKKEKVTPKPKKNKEDEAQLKVKASKSSLTSSKNSKDEKKTKGDTELGAVAAPELKEHVARAIARAARYPNNQRILHEQEVEKKLFSLLSADKPGTQAAAAMALGEMSFCSLSKDTIGQSDGLDLLIKLCRSDNSEILEAVSATLANITTDHPTNCSELVKRKGLDLVVSLLGRTEEFVIANAAIILNNMACDEQLRSEVIRLSAVSTLAEILKTQLPLCLPDSDQTGRSDESRATDSPTIIIPKTTKSASSKSSKTSKGGYSTKPLPFTESNLIQEKILVALASFVLDGDGQIQVLEAGCLETIVRLLLSKHEGVRKSASWLICRLATDESVAQNICKLGGLGFLQHIQQSESKKNSFSELALELLFNQSLVAKFAFTGELSCNNVIGDGFYDIGQFSFYDDLSCLLSLEVYSQEPIQNNHPVIVVNPKPLKVVSPVPSSTLEREPSEKGSRIKDGSSKTKVKKSQKEKEAEKSKEEEQQHLLEVAECIKKEPEIYHPLEDNLLFQMIQECQSSIYNLLTTKDQIVCLAQYVSEKLGGQVHREYIYNFEWDAHIQGLKIDLKSNIVPLGMIKFGIHYHRALLFKVLADRLGIQCSLVRGNYNRSWNEVTLLEEMIQPCINSTCLAPVNYIVDLIYQPGCLMPVCSKEAKDYQKY